jgi:threonine dehydrogenase-like Zn-dependent dehydrogenase
MGRRYGIAGERAKARARSRGRATSLARALQMAGVMRAVVVEPGRQRIELVEREAPRLRGDRGVLLRVLEVGLCGTDREIARFDHGRPPPGRDALVIGHEALAEVEEVGPSVEALAPGDLVVPVVRRPCPHPSCAACRSGHQDFCYTGDFTERGIQGRDGFLADRAVDEEGFLVRVPSGLRPVAVLTEPLTIAEKALRQIFRIQERLPWACPAPGAEVARAARCQALVFGAGPVGLLGAMALRFEGFDTWVYSREPDGGPKSRLVGSLGAHYASSEDVDLDALVERTGGIDVVYEASGATQPAFDLLERLGPNGVFVFTGIPGRKASIEVDGPELMRRLVLENQVAFGTVNASRGDYEAALRHLAQFERRWPEALRSVVTERPDPKQVPELLRNEKRGIKEVVTLGV